MKDTRQKLIRRLADPRFAQVFLDELESEQRANFQIYQFVLKQTLLPCSCAGERCWACQARDLIDRLEVDLGRDDG